MTVLLLTALLQVLYRLISWIKTPWTLELITFLFSASVWLGISIAIHDDSHVGIKVVYHLFPKKIKKIMKLFSLIIFGVMMIFFGILGSEVLIGYFLSQSKTTSLHLGYWIVRSPIFFGSILSIYRLIEKINLILKDKDPEFIYDISYGLDKLDIEELQQDGFMKGESK
jgi:TRAP-type C4-dicarboxylate transport system permease small subunit